MDAEFRKQVKDVLEHLYDTAYLQVHPLLSRIADITATDQTTRAQRLRGLLKDAIESLRPQQGSPATSPEWRSYLALRYHYVQGMSSGQTESELGISLRQLQRELHKGVDAVAQLLWDMRLPHVEAPLPPGNALPEEVQALHNELHHWQLARQPHDMRILVAETLAMLKPTLDQQSCTTEVDLAVDVPPVLADSTLTRQALLQVTRLIAQQADSIVIRCRRQGQQVALVFSGRQISIHSGSSDWQMAEFLIGQQGGMLAMETSAEGPQQVVLSLPSAMQTRVLVIDDNQAIHRLFERYLAPHQYDVVHAYSGQEALQLISEAHPDVITLDVMMPHIDGWQLLRDITQDPRTCHIPVIVCSVLREPELALALGARAYLKKPVDRLDLLATLARVRCPAGPAEAGPQSEPEAL